MVASCTVILIVLTAVPIIVESKDALVCRKTAVVLSFLWQSTQKDESKGDDSQKQLVLDANEKEIRSEIIF